MPTSTRQRINPSIGALWASAFVLAGMVVLQAGRIGGGTQAHAEAVQFGEMTLISADAGSNKDVVLVLDDKSDALLVYGIENRDRVELYQNLKLSEFFVQAKSQNRPGGYNR